MGALGIATEVYEEMEIERGEGDQFYAGIDYIMHPWWDADEYGRLLVRQSHAWLLLARRGYNVPIRRPQG